MTPTPELALQRLLREGGTDALTPLAIKQRRHRTYPNLVCFKYNQLNSPMGHPAVQDARGIILDEEDDWNVISMTFRKFFNLGEGHAAPIDWASATVEEKLDGSLMSLYHYAGQWHVQSSSSPDAGGPVVRNIHHVEQGLDFRTLFWQTWEALGYTLPPDPTALGARYTFGFEMLTPENEVVVPQHSRRLVLHGVRKLDTLQEEDAGAWAERLGYERARTYALGSEEVTEAANRLTAREGEGFVIRDAAFQRVKVKGTQYVTISILGEKLSEQRLAQAVLDGETDEILAYFPRLAPTLSDIRERIEAAARDIDRAYDEIKDLPDQKSFGLAAGAHPNAAALFGLRAGKYSSALAWLGDLEATPRLKALKRAGITFGEQKGKQP